MAITARTTPSIPAPAHRRKCIVEISMTKLGLSARAYDRILKFARTIADIEGAVDIQKKHLLEALSYRSLDRSTWGG